MRISICRGHILWLQTNIVPCICKHCLYIGVRIIKITFFFFFFWSSLYTVYLVKRFLFYSTSHFNLLAWNSIMTFKCCFMNKRWKTKFKLPAQSLFDVIVHGWGMYHISNKQQYLDHGEWWWKAIWVFLKVHKRYQFDLEVSILNHLNF